MKKLLSLLLSVAVMTAACFCFSSFCFAETYCDSVSEIQYALYENFDDESDHITVNVKPGTYTLGMRLVINSNTTLNCEGATFVKSGNGGIMLAIGEANDEPTGNDYYQNITVNGGTFDPNGESGSIFVFAHAKNVTINGSTFVNCTDGHHITFAGCDNVNITNCTFSGHVNNVDNNMEAVQPDILEPVHFPVYRNNQKSYDGTMNTNINIVGNTFTNVFRGVGSHSVFAGKYMSGVNISNNTFKNIAGYAVLASSYINSKINNNTIVNCGSGIYYKTISPKINKSTRPNTYKLNGKLYPVKVDSATEICNNKIQISDTKDKTTKQWPYAIRLYGEVVKSNESYALKGDYSAQNIKISGNSITVSRDATGIWLDGAKKCKITKNKITYDNSKYKGKMKLFGIRVASSNNISVNSNTISLNKVPYIENGIYIIKTKNANLNDNKITGAKLHGIYLTQNSTAKINKCTASSVKGEPICVVGGAKASIKGCKTSKSK